MRIISRKRLREFADRHPETAMPQIRSFVTVVALPLTAFAIALAGGTVSAQPKIAAPKIDLRPEFAKRNLDVRQQGKRGACQVFAMVGVVEYLLARRGEPVDLSEQFIMWAANEATGLNRTEGFNPDLLIAGLKQYGICTESLMPYVPRNEAIVKPSAQALQDASTRTSCKIISIKHWSSAIGFNDKDIAAITRQLDKGVPVTATLCWPFGLDD